MPVRKKPTDRTLHVFTCTVRGCRRQFPNEEALQHHQLEVHPRSNAAKGLRRRREESAMLSDVVTAPPPLKVARHSDVRDQHTQACPNYSMARQLADALVPSGEGSYYYDHVHDYCFCRQCCQGRGDLSVYRRGGEDYHLPLDFVRIALPLGKCWARAMGVFENWPVAYHPVQHPEAVVHFVETMAVLHVGDIGPFAQPLRASSSASIAVATADTLEECDI